MWYFICYEYRILLTLPIIPEKSETYLEVIYGTLHHHKLLMYAFLTTAWRVLMCVRRKVLEKAQTPNEGEKVF